MSKRIILSSYSDRIFDITNYALLSIILLLYIYPMIFIISASVSDPVAVWNGLVWLLPKNPSLDGYKMIFQNENIWVGYKNTIIYTVVGTALNLFMTITAAYPLSRKDFYGRNLIMGILTFTMFFGGGLIPTYLIVKNLGMIDKIWALVIPGAVSIWNIIVTKTYFQTNISEELREAATIDGCGNTKFLTHIVLPTSMPIIAVMTLFYAVGNWNSYFSGLIYLSTRSKFPLQLFLREILITSQVRFDILGFDPKDVAERARVSDIIKYGVIIVSSLPVLIMYPFIQKHFVKGIMVGSLKG